MTKREWTVCIVVDISLLALAFFAGTRYAHADPNDWKMRGTEYDWKTGTNQTWEKEWDGGVKVEGTNYRTGTTWEREVEPQAKEGEAENSRTYATSDKESQERRTFPESKCVAWGSEKTCF